MLGRTGLTLWFVLLWVVFHGAASLALGQGLTVSTLVTPNQIKVGDEARLTISVRGGPRLVTGVPDLIAVPGLTVTYAGQTTQSTIRDGRRERAIVMAYSVKADKQGLFVIPAQKFLVDGNEMASRELRLYVKERPPEQANNIEPTVVIELPTTSVYMGEVVPIALVISVPTGARFQATDHPKLNPEGFALKRFGPAVLTRAADGKTFEYRYKSSISAIRSGKLSIGPAQLAFTLFVPRTGLPRQPLGRRTTQRTFRLKADAVSMAVKPLPIEGKPEEFAGAVGQFTMKVSASPTELKVNDPLVIDVRLTGRGNFDQLTVPTLTEPFGWQLYEARQYVENRTTGLQPGTVAFSQVARPSELLAELCPLVFSYFDPAAEKYVTLRSEPIPLMMSVDDRAAKTTIEGKDFSVPAARIPQEDLGDVLTIFDRPGRLRKADGSSERPAVLVWGLAFGYAGGALGIMSLSLWRSASERRRQRLERVALAETRTAPQVLAELEKGGLAAKDFYTKAAEYCRLFKNEDSGKGDHVGDILRKAEFLKFGARPGESSEALNASERDSVLETLRSLSKSSS